MVWFMETFLSSLHFELQGCSPYSKMGRDTFLRNWSEFILVLNLKKYWKKKILNKYNNKNNLGWQKNGFSQSFYKHGPLATVSTLHIYIYCKNINKENFKQLEGNFTFLFCMEVLTCKYIINKWFTFETLKAKITLLLTILLLNKNWPFQKESFYTWTSPNILLNLPKYIIKKP